MMTSYICIIGEFVDDYTVRVIDVFAMPQTGTGVSVEAVDPVFQVCLRLTRFVFHCAYCYTYHSFSFVGKNVGHVKANW